MAPNNLAEQPPIEDSYIYVIGKAQKGLGLTTQQLADHTGLTEDTIDTLKAGGYTPCPKHKAALMKLAFCLQLNGTALVNLAENTYQPPVTTLPKGLAMFTTPFGGDMTVNAYVIFDEDSGLAITADTGSSCQPMLDFAKQHGLTLAKHVVTHTHLDHLADIDKLMDEGGGTGYGPAIENPLGLNPLNHGDGLIVGNLRIRVLGTHGHTPGGLSYYITGLAKPIVITGDALFAGSMGGAPQLAYQTALNNNRDKLLTLPNDTIVCPGHGPLSTIGHERQHNPFFTSV